MFSSDSLKYTYMWGVEVTVRVDGYHTDFFESYRALIQSNEHLTASLGTSSREVDSLKSLHSLLQRSTLTLLLHPISVISVCCSAQLEETVTSQGRFIDVGSLAKKAPFDSMTSRKFPILNTCPMNWLFRQLYNLVHPPLSRASHHTANVYIYLSTSVNFDMLTYLSSRIWQRKPNRSH